MNRYLLPLTDSIMVKLETSHWLNVFEINICRVDKRKWLIDREFRNTRKLEQL